MIFIDRGDANMARKIGYLVVNFGGPRNLQEIEPFLIALLTDRDVIRTALPSWMHKLGFTWIAKRRAKRVVHDYQCIGGKSPIFEDTEALSDALRKRGCQKVVTFHRYLPDTHSQFMIEAEQLMECDEVRVFPLFPQFSYTTTGSIARWFDQHLCCKLINKFCWIKSYPEHPVFVRAFQKTILKCLEENQIAPSETLLLFSAHGLPQRYINTGDPYKAECERSFRSIASAFPEAGHQLSYQSLFGKEEWIRPYTAEFCSSIDKQSCRYQNIVVVPLSFTSDHIETLFEIEQQYLPILKEKGFNAIRCPALNRREDWMEGIMEIVQGKDLSSNQMLIRSLT